GGGLTGRYQRRRADADEKARLAQGNFDEEKQTYIAKSAMGLYVDKEKFRTGTDADGNAIYDKDRYEAAKDNAATSYAQRLGGGNKDAVPAVRASAVSTLDKLEKEATANRAILYQKQFGAEDAVRKAREELDLALADPGRKEDVKALV